LNRLTFNTPTRAMKILITGANGQLGTELRNLAPEYSQAQFVFTDIQELDITNPEAVDQMVAAEGIDIIINCAAYTAVDRAESDQPMARKINAYAPGVLAEAAAKVGAELIHVSTDYVFDGKSCVPYTEDMPTGPQSVYGSTKLEGEQLVLQANPKSIIVRTAWLYSPYGNNFAKTMLRLGREREQLGVVFDQIGSPTYALDLARAIMTIATSTDKTYGVFHYSNEGVISWYDFTKAIHRLAGITTCNVTPIRSSQYPTPATRPSYSVFDKQKIKDTYHVAVPYWEESLKQCIEKLLLQ